MAKQCPKPKRKRDATWFRDKVLLVEAQGNAKVLNEEELESLADPGIAEAKAVLMANLSSYGSDVLSKYLLETQNAAVQNTNSSAEQDAMILSMFEQLSNQVTNCNKLKPMLYDGSVIAKETNVDFQVADSEETLMLEEESRSKMLLKQSDPMVLKKKVNIKPINYAELRLLGIFLRSKTSNSVADQSFQAIQRLIDFANTNSNEKNKIRSAHALCSVCNECLFDANHAICLIDHVNSMNVHAKSTSKKNKRRKEWKPTRKVFNSVRYKWKPTGGTFTLVGNACPLTRLTATSKVPLKVPIPLEVVAPAQIVTRVYTRRPKVPKSAQHSKPKVAKSTNANRMEPGTSWGSDTSVAPSSSSLIDCRLSKLFCGIWTPDAPST
ncbi:hypothetical protein Tco_1230237 [Tanacetum coccineum]